MERIKKPSEELLNIKFSKQSLEFYEKSGYLSFYGNEIFGIDEYGLPNEWIPIYNFQDGNMAYLDYSSLNSENEPRVIMAFYNGKEYEVSEILAEDFGEFLLKLVQEQL